MPGWINSTRAMSTNYKKSVSMWNTIPHDKLLPDSVKSRVFSHSFSHLACSDRIRFSCVGFSAKKSQQRFIILKSRIFVMRRRRRHPETAWIRINLAFRVIEKLYIFNKPFSFNERVWFTDLPDIMRKGDSTSIFNEWNKRIYVWHQIYGIQRKTPIMNFTVLPRCSWI